MSVVLFDGLQSQIEVIIDTERNPWFKRAHVGELLGQKKVLMSIEGLDKQEMVRRDDMDATVSNPYPWSGPKDQQNKTDIFLSVYGVFYVIVRSKNPKGKELREWVMRDTIPRGLNDKIKELKDKHGGAIEDMTRRIEVIQLESERTMQEKDAQHMELQNERYVPYLQDTRKDNVMVIVQKNNDDEYPYVAICG